METMPICCGRCFDEVALFPAKCSEKPETRGGSPLGMYHCPDCGAMLLAGLEHPMLCARCIKRQHPSFDMDTVPASTDEPSLCVKTKGAYAGSKWRVVIRFPWADGERVVAEAVSIPGLLHIFDPVQLEEA